MAFFQRVFSWPVYAGVGAVHFLGKSYIDAKYGLMKYRSGCREPNNMVYWRNNSEYDAMHDVLMLNTPVNLAFSLAWPVGLPLNALPCIVRELNK